MVSTADRAANGLEDTWGRTELLRVRGYDEAIIAGTNGHVTTPPEPAAFEAGPPVAARTCVGCGKPLAGKQERWCGQQCKRKFYEARRRRAPKPSRPAAKASTAPRPAPAVAQAADSLTAALEPPWAVLAALADQLPQGWRLELVAGRAVFAWNKEN